MIPTPQINNTIIKTKVVTASKPTLLSKMLNKNGTVANNAIANTDIDIAWNPRHMVLKNFFMV